MRLSNILAVIVGIPLAIFSKVFSEVVVILALMVISPDKVDSFGTVNIPIQEVIFGVINLIILPFLIGYIVARISKTNVILTAFLVGLVSISFGLYMGFTANAPSTSLIKNLNSFSFIMFGAFLTCRFQLKNTS